MSARLVALDEGPDINLVHRGMDLGPALRLGFRPQE